MSFRSGFIGIIGRPNVGKSTLINRLVGQKIAITSSVAQTTRHRIKGVVTTEKGQLVFLDTPGFSKSLDKLGHYLTDEGQAALSDADIFVMVVDLSEPAGKGDLWVANQLKATGRYVLLALNKTDLLGNQTAKRQQHRESYLALFGDYPPFNSVLVSAKTGKNEDKIIQQLLRHLPEGPKYYDDDAVTDQRFREMSAEIIREKVLRNTVEEIPHSVAIGIERFEETPKITRIYSTLYVDQPSQKPILIGKNGQLIKTIGMQARKDIETLLDQHVYLELNVKVRENWRKDPQFLESLGLAPPKD